MHRSRMILVALLLCLVLPAAADAAKPKQQLYVSLGDSYAAGFQPTAPGEGRTTRNGFAYRVPELAARRGHRFKLVNFGCGGETATSFLERTEPCEGLGPGGVRYGGRTQMAAAERFLRNHRGKVGLITVSIGGNDVTACARRGADPIPCVAAAVQAIRQNVARIAERLRKAAGGNVRIVGLTYPDVIVGEWVGASPDQDLARLSVVAFHELINPALKEAYAAGRARFVDVTAATGAYGSLDETTTYAPFGVVPVPVAKVCELTYYCVYRDIHARSGGYKLIADLIVKTLPRR